MHNYFTNYHTHDSVETCRSVIICEMIVHLLVIVENKKEHKTVFGLSEGNQFSSHLKISMLVTLVMRWAGHVARMGGV